MHNIDIYIFIYVDIVNLRAHVGSAGWRWQVPLWQYCVWCDIFCIFNFSYNRKRTFCIFCVKCIRLLIILHIFSRAACSTRCITGQESRPLMAMFSLHNELHQFLYQKATLWTLQKFMLIRSRFSSSDGAAFTTQRPPWFFKSKNCLLDTSQGHARQIKLLVQSWAPFSLPNGLLDFWKQQNCLLGTPQGHAQQIKLVVQSGRFSHYTTTSLIFKNQNITFWQMVIKKITSLIFKNQPGIRFHFPENLPFV